MSSATAWPVRVAAVGPVAVGSVLWRAQGQLRVTVMVKGTFAMVADAAMVLVEPEPICFADLHEYDNPARSLRAVRELAPQLRQVDVVLYGHAHVATGAGRSVTRSTARLAILRDGSAVLEKRLLVLGDRRRGAEPASFERIPLGFERALGGIGFAGNPLGVGLGASTETEPNFVDPDDPAGRVACLGPIPSTFPERKRLLAGSPRRAVEQEPVAEIPSTLDWSYFQCAPADQRLELLRGDEWIELDGLTRGLRLRSRLPGASGIARVYGAPPGAQVPDWLPLRPDLVQIFGDGERCSIVWRGSFVLADEQAASALCVAGAVELPGRPVSWPSTAAQLGAARGAAPAAVGAEPAWLADGSQTVVLDGPPARGCVASAGPGASLGEMTQVLGPQELARAGVDLGTPFELAAPTMGEPGGGVAAAPAVPGAPWSANRAAAVPLPSGLGERTVSLASSSALVERAEAEVRRKADAEAEVRRKADADAEARRKADADAEARRKADADAEARRKADADAEARRKAEAESFAAEQAAAKAEEERRAAALQAQRKQAATQLRQGMYGGFKKKP